jgi:hypothetical protein
MPVFCKLMTAFRKILYGLFVLVPGRSVVRVIGETARWSRAPIFFAGNRSFSSKTWAAWRRSVALSTIFLAVLGVGSQKVVAQPQVTGQWVTLPYLMPINPIRLDLLHNGKLLIVAGSENSPTEHTQGISKAAVWDLAAQTLTVQQMLWDVFCNGGDLFCRWTLHVCGRNVAI